ncbi:MAG: HAD-IA family hydrolase [Halioglobus sp.]
MSVKVIAFGSIGTLIETSEIQRSAFNSAFKEHGLDWNWTRNDYSRMLGRSGGRQRIAAYANTHNAHVDASEIHQTKTKLFDAHVEEHGAPIRPGVQEVIEFAKRTGMQLALVSTTSEENIMATLTVLSGIVNRDDFAFVGNASMVESGKPAPDIYIKAMQDMAIKPDEMIAIEDSEPSLESPVAAGIRCIAFPGANTAEQNYDGAVVRVDALTAALFTDQ